MKLNSFARIAIAICAVIIGAFGQTSGYCGADLQWSLDDTQTILTIFGTGEMYNFTVVKDVPWSSYKSSFEKVVIQDGATSIGENAFYDCNMKTVDIPPSVTTIEESAFGFCEKLENITLPEDLVSIGAEAFYSCTALTSFKIPAKVTSFAYDALVGCKGLTSIEVEDGNTHFKSLNGVLFDFDGTTLVRYPPNRSTEYEIPSGVKTIGLYAFSDSVLKQVTIPDTVETLEEGAFYYCTKLESIAIPPRVTSLRASVFGGCSSITSVVIPESVTSIETYAFSSCSSLKNVSIPDTVTFIESYAFAYSSSITSVFYQGNVDMTGFIFYFQSDYLEVCVSPEYQSDMFGDKSVTSDTENCKLFRSLFNQCWKGALVDGEIVPSMLKNASNWKKQTNGCIMHECDNATGPVQWSLCNSTNEEVKMCVAGKCVNNETTEKPSRVSVEIELAVAVNVSDMNTTEILEVISTEFGVDTSGMSVAWETDEEGHITHVIVYVDDEETAYVLADKIDTMDKGDDCRYGILCKSKTAQVTVDPMSEATANHLPLLTMMLMAVLLLFIY